MPINATFDARQFEPRQMGGAHPVGNKFPFTITNTLVSPTKDNKGGKFAVEMTSPAGSITFNYNLWNESDQARKIAEGQLCALCHATGIFDVDFKNDGAALRGGVGMMDIGFQKGHEPTAEKPEGGYVEVKKIYDKNGQEPGKPVSGGAMPQQNNGFTQQPQQNQPQVNQGGFNANPNPAPAANNGGGAWGGNAQPQQQPQQNGGAQQWQPQGGVPEAAPWGAK